MLDSSNLYQPLAHLRNRQTTMPQGPRHEGVLLHPQVRSKLRADIRLEAFRIQARTVDLNHEWQRIHPELLETV